MTAFPQRVLLLPSPAAADAVAAGVAASSPPSTSSYIFNTKTWASPFTGEAHTAIGSNTVAAARTLFGCIAAPPRPHTQGRLQLLAAWLAADVHAAS